MGTHVFVHFGWRAGATLSMAFYAWQLFILLIRGPHCKRYTWFGYEGGLEYRRSVLAEKERMEEEKEREENRQSIATFGEKDVEKQSPNLSEKTAVASDSPNTALETSSLDKKDGETNKTSSNSNSPAPSFAEVPMSGSQVGASKLEV